MAALPRGEVHALIGSIALPNPASVALHEKFGFRRAADYPQIGFKFGRWIDVACFHRLLEAK
jgi:phosphinothricin acetyltransferase